MAISKARKDELMASYLELLDKSQGVFLAEYTGMSVKRLEALRAELRKANGVFHITKNTLLSHALEKTGRPVPIELLTGQMAAGFALGDAPTLAKTLLEYARKEELLKLRGAIIENRILTAEQVDTLSKLPSLDVLRAQIIGLINAPAQGLVSALTNGVRQVVNVLDAYAKKDEATAAEAAA